MDKLRAMETFVRIVDAGSLTAAAGGLGVSLTAVVRTLAGLETRLGLRLLNRTTRRMALTDEGRDYYALCRRILTELDEGEGALSHRRLAPSGTLRLTAPVMFGKLHVAPAVADFLDAHPAMRVEMMLMDRVTDLLEEGLDVAVRIGPLADSSLVAVTLGHTPRVVCASPGYLARHGWPAAPADLARHRCVCFTGLSADPDWEFRVEGRTVRVTVAGVLSTNQIDGAIDACRRGLGCGMFLGYQVADALAAGELVRILADYETAPRPVSLLYPHARLLSPRIRAFVDGAVPRLKRCLGE
ncbi:DNA-binding transcriptional LysR family regulator [Azospirillum fermentarium]|uniref:LysR family transcriptional regulator n=1 Tax=Azospirillum fermentarium TaxID=1233114 RepID=UPI0022278578|nr:LysR family transcriptional regulator [Azospirillum fermentarium]MCW2248182.1 DNA-binding transcriptional LysR family regulator [Azospirillum fermentarium]